MVSGFVPTKRLIMQLTENTRYQKQILWMRRLKVLPKDFSEKFICSPGKGGQNVNKVATTVAIVHAPTGLSVKCHAQRTQAANRWQAWTLLLTKIEDQQKRHKVAKIAKVEKLRRQKRGRSRAGKEKMLANKKIQSRKKLSRSRPSNHDE